MNNHPRIEIMDTTLRDGEQTSGVSFVPHEKLMIARLLLEDLKVDRVEVASARVSDGEFEAVKILRETRNDLNRANNAETANIARTVTASMKTINNIVKIMETSGLESLPIDLQEVAHLRVNHPDYSIQQLADSLSKPLTKSGVNHRLRKINKIADDL